MRYPPPRLVFLALGLVAAGLAVYLVVNRHTGLAQLIVFAIAPDIPLFFGAGSGLARGQLHPRAVPAYNAVHRFWVPIALLAIAAVLLRSVAWSVAALAWLAHIAFDRSSGFGLRTPEGLQR